ncbi:NADH-quinone oxidoreductase subunit NuoH [Thalassobacillus sp. CUG 92003]|uniref:NADH-quinone oxidoreductase subunit NuoH n=1 Tax=Thalassobacillus sp. CUG 92003 TaxID=2736641 RepID=UPI00351A4473
MDQLLQSPPGWSNFLTFMALGSMMLTITLGFVTYAILAERKIMGAMQLRHGPNQVGGRFGLLQTVADILKLLLKEDIRPAHADRALFIIAPILTYVPAFLVIAVLPFTEAFHFADIGIGLLYYIAISGLSTIGIVTAGWASNNKYALMGGMRAAAQMISYEIPLVMSVVGIILFTGSLNLIDIVNAQESLAFIFLQPIAFLIFFIAGTAELNRTPFDLPEAESELVAGYHVEYSGFRFAFFMLSEYVYLFAISALITILFLGGWHDPIPYLELDGPGLGAIWFSLKFIGVVFLFIWVRVSFPRLRADQLMEFGWKVLLPVALANIFVSAVIKEFFF